MSKRLTLNAAGDDVAIAEASITDIFTSYIDRNVTVTGAYGVLKDAVSVAAGAMVENYIHTGSAFKFTAA